MEKGFFENTVQHIVENVEESIKHAVMKNITYIKQDGEIRDIYFKDGIADEMNHVTDEVYDFLAPLTDSEMIDLYVAQFIDAGMDAEKSEDIVIKKFKDLGFKKMRADMLEILVSEVFSSPRVSICMEETKALVVRDYTAWLQANGERVNLGVPA